MKNFNEMFLGFIVVALITFFSLNAQANTYIDYDDGSSFTVPEGAEVYVSSEIIFTKRQYANKHDMASVEYRDWQQIDGSE